MNLDDLKSLVLGIIGSLIASRIEQLLKQKARQPKKSGRHFRK